MQISVRAATIPGRSTLWTRMLDRLLRRHAARPEGAAVPEATDAGTAPVRASLSEESDGMRPRGPLGIAAGPVWIAPLRLPELLTAPRRHVPGLALAA
jgi:hypothetical protein